MNTIKIIIVLVLLNVVVQTFGQHVFYKTVDSIKHEVSPESILENTDSTIMVAGTIGGPLSNSDLFIAKLNSSGVQLWLRYISAPRGEYNSAMVQGMDSGYLLSATSYSYPILKGDNDSIKDILVIKVNEKGIEEWRTVLPAYDQYVSTVSPDGSYIIYGEWINEWAVRNKGNFNSFIIYKLDKKGNVLWRKIIGTNSNGYKFDSASRGALYCDKNSNIYFSGETDSGATNYLHGLLYKLAPNGNLIYRKFFEENKKKRETICPRQIFEMQGKHYYNRAHEIYEFNLVTGEEKKLTNFKASKTPYRSLAHVAAKGNNISAIFSENIYDEGKQKEIAKLDSDFNVYWSKRISVPGKLWSELFTIQSMPTLDDGNLFLFHEKDSNENDYGRVIKTDCNGNYDVWRACTVGEEEKATPEVKIIIYPNPSSACIKVSVAEYCSYKIYSNSGKLVKSGDIDLGNNAIDIEFLEKGFYHITIFNAFSNKYSNMKFIKN